MAENTYGYQRRLIPLQQPTRNKRTQSESKNKQPTKANEDKADMGPKKDIPSAERSKVYLGTYQEPSKRATKRTREVAKDKAGLATKRKDNRAEKDRCISYPSIEEKVEAMHPRLSGYAISSAGLYPLSSQAISSRKGGLRIRRGEAYQRY